MVKNKNAIAVAIYSHPELYRPLLNAIDELSNVYSTVVVISRNLYLGRWVYPKAVKYFVSGKYVSIRASELKSSVWKLFSFLKYTNLLYKVLNREKPQWIMCNDPISLMAFRLMRRVLTFKVKLWYHNHDVAELNMMRKYSIGYYAVKSEQKHFNEIDLFTLPSESRLRYFPVNSQNKKWLLVPNYPGKKRTGVNIPIDEQTRADLKIIYQGRISDEHGLEEMLDYLKVDQGISLTIIGPGKEDFIEFLRNRGKALDVQDRLDILEAVPYGELLNITMKHQIGWAVNKPGNIIYSTGAQSSNKIYEYASVGLPIVYYGSEHYITHLSKFKWAFPTDLSAQSLENVLNKIRSAYKTYSQHALTDFSNGLNYENVFEQVLSALSELESSKR